MKGTDDHGGLRTEREGEGFSVTYRSWQNDETYDNKWTARLHYPYSLFQVER